MANSDCGNCNAFHFSAECHPQAALLVVYDTEDGGLFLQCTDRDKIVVLATKRLGSAAERAECCQRLSAAGCPVPAVEARTRYAWIREATHGCLTRPAKRPVNWTDRIDRVLKRRLEPQLEEVAELPQKPAVAAE